MPSLIFSLLRRSEWLHRATLEVGLRLSVRVLPSDCLMHISRRCCRLEHVQIRCIVLRDVVCWLRNGMLNHNWLLSGSLAAVCRRCTCDCLSRGAIRSRLHLDLIAACIRLHIRGCMLRASRSGGLSLSLFVCCVARL